MKNTKDIKMAVEKMIGMDSRQRRYNWCINGVSKEEWQQMQ